MSVGKITFPGNGEVLEFGVRQGDDGLTSLLKTFNTIPTNDNGRITREAIWTNASGETICHVKVGDKVTV